MRIDLHVHSKHSTHPNEWILRKLGAQESYTEPEDVYRIAKARGMDAVTITDHNTIDGCLAIAHHSDTFISCEYTTYFPSDGCKVHVVCYHITPEQHRRIQQVRSNIFTLVAFLKKHNIVHTLAHALFSPNSKLTADHFSHLFDLFNTWEINGAKDKVANTYLKRILECVKPRRILTAGSDDHSSLTIGRMWTEVPGASSISEFFAGVQQGRVSIGGESSTPHTLAWNIYSVGWQWLKDTGVVNGSLSVLDRYLLPSERAANHSLVRKIWQNTKSMSPRNWGREIALAFVSRELERTQPTPEEGMPPCKHWFNLVDAATSKHIAKLGNKIVSDLATRNFYDLFSTIGLPVALYMLLAPFLVAFGKFASQRALGREILQRYGKAESEPIKVGKFTDTFGTVDGVSCTLDEQLREAVRTGKDYTIISCVGENNRRGLKLFEPLGMLDTPEFEQQKLCWPPLLRILEYCYTEQFTHIQAATPGPVGLAAMVTAKTLGLPFQAVYHTQIPEFVGKATNDVLLEELAWKYCLWFYESADQVFTPSEYTRRHLIKHGLKPDKVQAYPRGIDTELFSPAKRSDYWTRRWGTARENVKALYVGRVSVEKNLPLLVTAFKKLTDHLRADDNKFHSRGVDLLVVGDGAYAAEMRQACSGYPVVFTGELHGEELAQAFASADFLVFPSTTDTFGRVVLEAMASGIPCIVSDVGGPRENVAHGDHGLIVPADNEAALVDAMRLMAFSLDRAKMGRAARLSTESRSFSKSFAQYWSLYAA
jgi:glycosyltransferase involved in cell wall biosynthesis/predicted metal-dependent phosphoesterase TrpH